VETREFRTFFLGCDRNFAPGIFKESLNILLINHLVIQKEKDRVRLVETKIRTCAFRGRILSFHIQLVVVSFDEKLDGERIDVFVVQAPGINESNGCIWKVKFAHDSCGRFRAVACRRALNRRITIHHSKCRVDKCCIRESKSAKYESKFRVTIGGGSTSYINKMNRITYNSFQHLGCPRLGCDNARRCSLAYTSSTFPQSPLWNKKIQQIRRNKVRNEMQ
jgi:hypothetical protein